MADNQPEIDYKQVREELDKLVSELEVGELDIDVSIKTYQRAQKLIEQLEEYLRSSENKITKLTADK